ncbi:O-methyltransferase [Bacillus sp. CH126_4D]|uniref:O-methyltransferase n=1 Tax=unclassified Bacillus (in: firmicutes) TaxID=185979 RepID=UPI00124F7453|nr:MULTISPECIES: O-methyltransferase [unclassified Bacillus (in: firmicutes)]KAB2457512.1 O-methyltransferase [Bacillus sp. CH140a_4T]KAB2471410.1 O-methyltransferase [Bacillus sp. CH126_4D]
MEDAVNEYLLSFIDPKDKLILEMEDYAKENHVPIMDRLGMEFMLQFLRLIGPKSILELGTAIGYSSIRMMQAIPNSRIVTVERNRDRYEKALEYIECSSVKERISVIYGDALETGEQVEEHGTFDVIFIDAAKGQYRRFFDLYEPLLNPGGVIISDNVMYHGLVTTKEKIENRRTRGLIRRIKTYNEWLMNHEGYDTTIFPIGDGVAVSKKRG